MNPTRLQKIALALAGITAAAIGGFILLAPHAFYASYGITLGQNPNLLSELRAPGAGLLALGMVMLSGLVRAAWLPIAFVAALTVYIAFPVGRIASLFLDGTPSSSVLAALVIEIAIAVLCLVALRRSNFAVHSGPVQGQTS